MGTLCSFPPLPLTWMTAPPSSVVRMSPTFARRSSSARSPASSAVRMMARSVCSIGFVFRVTVLGDGRQKRLDRGAGEGLGQILGQFGSADQLHRVGAESFAGVEEGAQHIPARPAAPYQGRFMIVRVARERRPHRLLRYVNHFHAGRIAGRWPGWRWPGNPGGRPSWCAPTVCGSPPAATR